MEFETKTIKVIAKLSERNVTYSQRNKITASVPKDILDAMDVNAGDKLEFYAVYENGMVSALIRPILNEGIFVPKRKRARNELPNGLRHEVFKRDGYKCVECGATNKDVRLEVDHIVPLSNGGSDELTNLQTLCHECNMSKSADTWKGGISE